VTRDAAVATKRVKMNHEGTTTRRADTKDEAGFDAGFLRARVRDFVVV
jgi:hypothetical protein